MSNIQITLATNHLSVTQNERLSRSTVVSMLGVNVTTNTGRILNNNYTVDLSRIDTRFPGTYHGSINVVDPNDGTTAFRNFDVTVLPNTQSTPTNPKRKTTSNRRPKRSGFSKKKLLIILGIFLVLICLITACHQHKVNQQRQDLTAQQVQDNKKNIKSNAAANAQLQKQLDDLKAAQSKYQQDHDKNAYESKLNDLEKQNNELQNQVQDSALSDRIQRFGNILQGTAENPDNGNNPSQDATQATKMNNLWNKFQAMFYNWLNN